MIKQEVLNNRRVPDGFVLMHENLDLGIQIYTSPDQLRSIGFQGRACKHSFKYRFRSVEEMKAHAAQFEANVTDRKKSIASRREKNKAIPRDLVVGDVLGSSWGYDQTNVMYYQVTKLVGEKSVELRRISRENTSYDCNGGRCIPIPDSFVDKFEPIVRRVSKGNVVDISDYETAFKESYTMQDGVKVFTESEWSSNR